MRAGQLRHRIEIHDKSETTDDYGGTTETWAKLGTNGDDWAQIYELRGGELIEAMQLEQRPTARIRMRYRSDIDETMRIVHGSTTYEIIEIVNPSSRDIMLELVVREAV
jgi:SPP1 family predicted phage head-tail adaptor